MPSPSTFGGTWQGIDTQGKQHFDVVISDNLIKITWIDSQSDPDPNYGLFWIGTFHQSGNRILSEPDLKTMNPSGMHFLLSEDKVLTFTYDNNALTFQATALGFTRTIHLQK